MRAKSLLLATNNQGKMAEILALLQDLAVKLLTPEEIGLQLHVEEDGATYAENASKKAVAFARASGLASLADDTGLEVVALGGEPGLYSNRYIANPQATDADRRAYLLSKLRYRPRPWRAQFRAAVAVALPDGAIRVTEGRCAGQIIPEERGTGGFGYDAIFEVDGTEQTMAELTMDQKNRLSHRAQAINAVRPVLVQLLEVQAAGRAARHPSGGR
jgi:XTP/dITP diphosphohydrolase